MKSVLAYIRNLIGFGAEDPTIRTSFKRDRADDDFSFDDDSPALKRLKQLKRTNFSDVMASNDIWEKEDKTSGNVRYVPIQAEAGHPSTSTPNETSRLSSRMRTVPVKLVGIRENGAGTPARKPRMHTPVRPVVLDDDDDEPEITWVESKPDFKKPTKVYINLDDEDNDVTDSDDVIFVKKVTTPPPVKPYKFFVAKNDHNDIESSEEPVYYRIRKSNDRNSILSPKSSSKFIAPPRITKAYRKPPNPVSRWLQPQKTSGFSLKNRYLNGNARSTLSEVFNLEEKKSYQELIRSAHRTNLVKPVNIPTPSEIINLTDDAASFRFTQRAQKSALNELKFLEAGLRAEKENEATKEYDPITVASINSSDSEIEVVSSESSSSSVRIGPINTFKESFKDKPVTSGDWLQKVNSKYKKKDQDNQEKIKDAQRDSDIISKVNHEQKLALLAHKFKCELSLPESLIEEPQPTVELPKLTPEQEKLVSRALGPGPPGQLLVEKFNLRIHRRDLQTLSGLNWLNDEVINFYMNLLMQRSEQRSDLPKVYAANTFFYPKLMQAGQAGLRRWTRKVDIFAHDLMVVPVHLGVHWCMSLVYFGDKKIHYLDSMGARNQACLDALLQYLRDEHKDKKGAPFDDSGWKTECLKDIPQQMNGSDCGMFACTFAEFAARGAPFTFSQAHMPYLRRKAALEILTANLLL